MRRLDRVRTQGGAGGRRAARVTKKSHESQRQAAPSLTRLPRTMPPSKKKLGPNPLLTEVVDYETSGPDIDAHKRCSNQVFMFFCCGLTIVLGVIVLLDLKKKGKAAKASIGTAKG